MLRAYIHVALGVVLATVIGRAQASINVTSPWEDTVVKTGETITARWDLDPSGTWKNMTITLMTGCNNNMAPMLEVGSGIDATVTREYTFTAPDVTPNSAIYFLQFFQAGQYDWTSRFTILDSKGTPATVPKFAVQPETGDDIPWDLGRIVGQPPPTPTLDAILPGDSTKPAVEKGGITTSATSSLTKCSAATSSTGSTTSATDFTTATGTCSSSCCATASPTTNGSTTTTAPCSASSTKACQYVTFTDSAGGRGLSMTCSGATVADACSTSSAAAASNVSTATNGTSAQPTAIKAGANASGASQGPLAMLSLVMAVVLVPAAFSLT